MLQKLNASSQHAAKLTSWPSANPRLSAIMVILMAASIVAASIAFGVSISTSRKSSGAERSVFDGLWALPQSSSCGPNDGAFRFSATYVEFLYKGQIAWAADNVSVIESSNDVKVVSYLHNADNEKEVAWTINFGRTPNGLLYKGQQYSAAGKSIATAADRYLFDGYNQLFAGGEFRRCR